MSWGVVVADEGLERNGWLASGDLLEGGLNDSESVVTRIGLERKKNVISYIVGAAFSV